MYGVFSPKVGYRCIFVFYKTHIGDQYIEIFVGEIIASADRNRTITNNKIITGHGQTGVVEGIALTQFHVLTLHSNCIAATCLLNNQLVFLDEFDKRDPVCGLIQSPTEASPWVYSARAVYTYRIKKRDIYLLSQQCRSN